MDYEMMDIEGYDQERQDIEAFMVINDLGHISQRNKELLRDGSCGLTQDFNFDGCDTHLQQSKGSCNDLLVADYRPEDFSFFMGQFDQDLKQKALTPIEPEVEIKLEDSLFELNRTFSQTNQPQYSSHEESPVQTTLACSAEQISQIQYHSAIKQLGGSLRLNYQQRSVIDKIIAIHSSRNHFQGKDFNQHLQASMKNLIGKISKDTPEDTKAKRYQSVISKKRCNHTSYVRNLLKCFVVATSRIDCQNESKYRELYEQMDKSTKIDQIRNIMHQPGSEQYVQLLRVFLEPGNLFIQLIENLNNDDIVSILLLEAVHVLKIMINEPRRKFNSWIVGKIKIKGDYNEAIRRIDNGTATLKYIKGFVKSEYNKCKPNFKTIKGSPLNNISHFMCSMTHQMLLEVLPRVDPCNRQLIMFIKEGLNHLEKTQSEQSLEKALCNSQLKRIILESYIRNSLMLKRILSIETTHSLMIMNLVDRYDHYVKYLQDN